MLRPLLLATALLAASLPSFAGDRLVKDADGRSIAIADTSRIVAIGGAVSETLFALGLGDRVVADDLTSDFPAAARNLPKIGYMRTLSAEGVLSVNPTLVLAIAGSGPRETIDVLEDAAVPFVLVPEAIEGHDAVRTIRFISDAVGAQDRGLVLADAVSDDLDRLSVLRQSIAKPRRAVFVLGMSGGAPLVAGRGTAADAMFALAGVENALASVSGYKPATDEAVLAAAPDAVVVMSGGGHSLSAQQIFALPAFTGTPAARDRRLIVVEGSYTLNLGPRIAHAARDLAAAVYPELNLPPLPERPWTSPRPSANPQ